MGISMSCIQCTHGDTFYHIDPSDCHRPRIHGETTRGYAARPQCACCFVVFCSTPSELRLHILALYSGVPTEGGESAHRISETEIGFIWVPDYEPVISCADLYRDLSSSFEPCSDFSGANLSLSILMVYLGLCAMVNPEA